MDGQSTSKKFRQAGNLEGIQRCNIHNKPTKTLNKIVHLASTQMRTPYCLSSVSFPSNLCYALQINHHCKKVKREQWNDTIVKEKERDGCHPGSQVNNKGLGCRWKNFEYDDDRWYGPGLRRPLTGTHAWLKGRCLKRLSFLWLYCIFIFYFL